LRAHGFTGKVAVTAHRARDAEALRREGADLVLMPFVDAANECPDVIVMGTICRSGVEGLLIGNTAETVLDHADCSLMTLKPPGFVSPISL